MPTTKKKLVITRKTLKKNNFNTKTNNNTHKQLQLSIVSGSSSVKENKNEIPKNLENFVVPFNTDIIRPKIWELPNRKRFYDWVLNTFGKYETGAQKKPAKMDSEEFHLNNIQRLTRDFLQGESPYRGLLLYIGLGVGKTCAAVAISEAIHTKKQVIILSKTSLEDNFRKEIFTCGADYMATHNHWIFKKCDNDEELQFATHILGIPIKSITDNNGAFFIDFTKKSNYNTLNSTEREKLRNQINYLINERFIFIHTDGRLAQHIDDDIFNEKVVIIDEVHNIGSLMISESSKVGPKLYELLMKAKNPKYIFLSGTPLINQVFEATRLFNVLRGYMPTLIIKFKTTFDININYKHIKYQLSKHKHVDQIISIEQNKIIKVSKNPDYFINDSNGKGIVYTNKQEDLISFDEFELQITKLIESNGYKISVEQKMETCLPEHKKEFELRFYNPDLNKLKRIDLIKRRIAGLTSYYEYQDTSQYPKLLPIKYEFIPMSMYQFGVYETFRHEELEFDRNVKKYSKDDDKVSSSYRLKSRLACTFAFPEDIGSPYDNKRGLQDAEFIEMLAEKDSQFDLSVSDLELIKEKEIEKKIKASHFNILKKNKDKYLDVSNGSLAKYSPKYYRMLQNIKNSAGKILVYSFFKLFGLYICALVLEQTNEWTEFKIKKVNKQWELDENESDKGKYKYLFYTGTEDKEIREIYRNVYNSLWNELPASCDKLVKQLKEKADNNYYGQVVKMMMTNKTGAEGLDLKEVRQIHILESYWQHVLIDQIIGRGVRNRSHLKLPLNDRNVEVFIYMATLTPELVSKISYPDVRLDTYKYPNPAIPNKKGKVVTSDEHLYLVAEKKRSIINEFQKLMKESAFDCTLNYHDNKLNPINESVVCLDYTTKDRNQYLFTPDMDDTIDTLDLAQEKIVTTTYKSFLYQGKTYYHPTLPNIDGKIYIYDDTLKGRIRMPKPVGEFKMINNEYKKVFYKKKKNHSK